MSTNEAAGCLNDTSQLDFIYPICYYQSKKTMLLKSRQNFLATTSDCRLAYIMPQKHQPKTKENA
ncbi:MAG: hypothetical protein ABIR91_03210 [Candidatus Saccharimonadales bacterium]